MQRVMPVDKLLVMKRTILIIRESVNKLFQHCEEQSSPEQNGNGAINCADEVEFATDDLISILIAVIVKACCGQQYGDEKVQLIVDLVYCKEYHFCASAKSSNAFAECHFEVCVNWIMRYECSQSNSMVVSKVQNN